MHYWLQLPTRNYRRKRGARRIFVGGTTADQRPSRRFLRLVGGLLLVAVAATAISDPVLGFRSVDVVTTMMPPSSIYRIGAFDSAAGSSTSSIRSSAVLRRWLTAAAASSSSASGSTEVQQEGLQPDASASPTPPLYRSEGLFSVAKPSGWTSNDVVSYLRGILERDCRNRGIRPAKVGSRGRKNKNKVVRVGHGGTLDPLATGVLVIGVGKGTKELKNYLSGSKIYRAGGELGFETSTLDMEGNVTKRVGYDHVTVDSLKKVLPQFFGVIQQVPPIFSAIRKGGKKLYEEAREGTSAEDIKIEPREVKIHRIDLIKSDELPPKFEIEVECGGGTYIRSLIRDIGYALDTVATTTSLERIQQGQLFALDDAACLKKDDWTADNIYGAIDQFSDKIDSAAHNDQDMSAPQEGEA